MRSSRNVELARLKKKEERKKEKHFDRFAASWFGTFVMLFRATKGLVGHENTRRWMVRCYKRLQVYRF